MNFSESCGRDSINQNPQFLSVTVCDSLSGPDVQRENPSLSNVSSCLCALIYISHCSWGKSTVAGEYLKLATRGFVLKQRISQL